MLTVLPVPVLLRWILSLSEVTAETDLKELPTPHHGHSGMFCSHPKRKTRKARLGNFEPHGQLFGK